ncbi:MAG: Bax inhibitor-1/YccA family protein [Alphaproteobacteria bacterium]|nr:Bax inhibitor-1/YccA family protein [Alphaproteobacteria bacterium]
MRSVRTTFRRAVDVGLHTYLLGVYKYMGLGLLVSWGVSLMLPRSLGIFSWVAMFGTLGISFYFGAALNRMAASTAQILFWVYSALMGVALSHIVAAYTIQSIASAFFITGLTFGAMSIYGHRTQRDLTAMGSFLMMGFWGIFIASIVNIFLKSSMMNFLVSLIGVFVFTGLIAYQTQTLKQLYYALPNNKDIREKMSILGALNLYMSVINLFLSLLHLGGERK